LPYFERQDAGLVPGRCVSWFRNAEPLLVSKVIAYLFCALN